MKKLITIIFGIVLVYSCSTSTDSNGNTNTTVVPLPPSNLSGTVASTTQINLSWTDNSTNETGFKIERRTGTGIYAIVGTVNSNILTFSDSDLLQNTTYIYRVYSYNTIGNSLTYSNELNLTTNSLITIPTLPTLTTQTVSSSATNTAYSGGLISSDGGAPIIVRGICWSTIANPTIDLATKTIDGTGTGVFYSNISGLTANTTYYLRAYATNSVGTSYGNELSFSTTLASTTVTDINGNTYPLVTICAQVWTTKNLAVTAYSDGTVIPQVTDPTAWLNLTTGAWCYYNNDASNGVIYGKLYNWYAVAGIYNGASLGNSTLRKKLVPTGWHVPTDGDWTTLTTCLGGVSVAGGKMKETGTAHWNSPNQDATNISGFTGIPSAYRLYNGTFIDDGGCKGYWWSSSEFDTTNAWLRYLSCSIGGAMRGSHYKKYGFSVRCLKD